MSDRGRTKGGGAGPIHDPGPGLLLVIVASLAWPATAAAQDLGPDDDLAFAEAGAGPKPIEDISLEELLGTVSGVSKRDERTATAPATVTVLTRLDFERWGWRNVAEALESVPGLYVSSGRSQDFVGVRGLSLPRDTNTRLLVLVDGHTMNSAWSGASSLGELLSVPAETVERVEVIRGPSSSIYGSNAFLAVVNIVTRRPRDTEPRHGALSLSTSSVGLHRLVAAAHRRGPWGIEGSGYVTLLGGDGPAVTFPGMTRPRLNEGLPPAGGVTTVGTDHERGLGWGGALRWRDLALQLQWADRGKGLPSARNDAIFGDPYNALHDERGFGELRWQRALGAHGAMVRLFTDCVRSAEYAHRDPTDWPAGTFLTDDPHTVLSGSDDSVGAEAQATLALGARDTLILGAEVQRHSVHQLTYELETSPGALTPFGEPHPDSIAGGIRDASGEIPKIALWNVGVYVQNTWEPARRLDVVTGLRVDGNSVFTDDLGDALVHTSPRLALVYQATERTTAKLLFGEAFRNPTLFEAYFDDSASVCGNPGIRPERQRTLELAATTQPRDTVELSGSAYAFEVEDLLVREPVDACYVSSGPRLRFVNQGRIRAAGAEAGLRVHTPTGWLGFASMNLGRAWRAEEGGGGGAAPDAEGDRLPNSPVFTGSAGLSFPLWQERVFGSLQASYVSERLPWTLDPAEAVAPRLRVDAAVTARRLLHGLTGALRVTNALDASYGDPVTSSETRTRTIPGNGIAVYGTVGHDW